MFKASGVYIYGSGFDAVSVNIGWNNTLTAQKSHFLARYFSFGNFEFMSFHISTSFIESET
jgi:hypothetical protein